MSVQSIERCRVCGSRDLAPILSLGDQYAVHFPDHPSEESVRAPLDLVLCSAANGGCGLLQLQHTLDHDLLYRKYWYQSGISTTMVQALADIVEKAERWVDLRPGDIVVDIGSNDGTLLSRYNASGINRIGFEPSNLWELGRDKGHTIINDYFNSASYHREAGDQKAKVITSIAMFYDLEEPNTFVEDITRCLDPDGIWIIQMNYLGLMLEENTFDNISHEHLEYYSLLSLENLLQRHGLEAVDVELNDVNGGSFRIMVKKTGGVCEPDASERLKDLRDREAAWKLEDQETYNAFAKRIGNVGDHLVRTLEEFSEQGLRVYIYGASTRGLVVLQYTKITSKLIEAAVDKNDDKWGKYIVGTGIPIISFDDYRKDLPDVLFVLPYQFRKEIMRQEVDFLKGGGKMMFALPELEVVDSSHL